ncbi:radical SAM family heme chaperone HemW [Marinicrinis lubricantis]|uniref:Heme chaperone HemW n=1 Tax=Marinicrinis lubricantis TaxID=2086470 RepID=A0ABW1IUU4_9BACL
MIHTMETPKAVYVHIPFCRHKCYYCDFNTYALKNQPVMKYLQAMEREIEQTVKQIPPDTIETIFIGGGTPTALSVEEMRYLLQVLNTYFPNRSTDFEFTSEANPGTTDDEKFNVMYEGGVNRMSFGVQTFRNELLVSLGRIHDVDDVYRSIERARKTGFRNLSIDLMFGLPRQTLADMEHSLNSALQLDLTHYSLYSLKVEESTLFHTLYERNELPLPEEETEVAMYEMIMHRLQKEGYRQYEISNFAKPGFESRHNSMYWRNKSYYGFGAGAHGYMHGIRHMNVKGVQAYIDAAAKGLPRLEEHRVDPKEAMEDFMMVGLRMMEGVKRDGFREQFGIELESVFGPILTRLVQLKALERDEQGYRLSRQAIPIGNEVFGEFVGSIT